MRELDDRWKTWIWQNVGRGCDKDHIFKALHERGFSYPAIRDELRHEPAMALDEIEVPMASTAGLGKLDPDTLERRELSPFLWEVPDVLSPGDCAVLIDAARHRLHPSTVVTDAGKQGGDGQGHTDGRTSSNVEFVVDDALSPEFAAVVSYLRRFIADLTHLPESHQEGIQIVHYGVGEKFEPHRDAFPEGSDFLRWEGLRGGQRMFSFMVYLNDVDEGGETVFPELGISVPPELGKGIVWPNVTNDGRRSGASLHGSVPIEKGEKWVLVCWIRESTFGEPLAGPGISDLRGIDAFLEPPASLEPEDWIVKQTRDQLRTVPHLGAGGPGCRGFEKKRLDSELYREILATYRSVSPELRIEEGDAIGSFVGTVRPELPACLYYEVAELNSLLQRMLKPLHEEWCQFELTPTACYGFRVYLPGAFLLDHVDRPSTHVVSSTICVDRDLYAPWPLHAVDADGRDHQVEIEPGELLLYESARIPHGRPIPLNGRYYAGLFVHYQPAEDSELWVDSPRAWYEKHRPRTASERSSR